MKGLFHFELTVPWNSLNLIEGSSGWSLYPQKHLWIAHGNAFHRLNTYYVTLRHLNQLQVSCIQSFPHVIRKKWIVAIHNFIPFVNSEAKSWNSVVDMAKIQRDSNQRDSKYSAQDTDPPLSCCWSPNWLIMPEEQQVLLNHFITADTAWFGLGNPV